MTNRTGQDTPRIHIPPPLIVAGFIGLGIGLDRHFHTGLMIDKPGMEKFGVALVTIGLGLIAWTMMYYRNNKTNILPDKPDQTLICGGPFRLSRNPIYLGMIIIHIGVTVLYNGILTLTTVFGSYFVLRYYVIAREEAYLKRRFGEPHLAYKRRVRRWI